METAERLFGVIKLRQIKIYYKAWIKGCDKWYFYHTYVDLRKCAN